MTMISLVYVSIATKPMTEDELTELLDLARNKNKKLGITGMLLYRDDYFIQALEGEAEAVKTLYNRIAEDERHQNVLLVFEEKITERSFGDWSMGFNNINHVDPHEIPAFTEFLSKPFDLNFLTDHPSRAKDLLVAFRNRAYF